MLTISGTEMVHVATLSGEFWRRLAAESGASSPLWKHAYGPNHAQVDALLVGGGGTGTWVPWFMPANWPHEAPMGWGPHCSGSIRAWGRRARKRRRGHMGMPDAGTRGHATAL